MNSSEYGLPYLPINRFTVNFAFIAFMSYCKIEFKVTKTIGDPNPLTL